MNAQTQDQSYYTMIAEHQDISARVLRLHRIFKSASLRSTHANRSMHLDQRNEKYC